MFGQRPRLARKRAGLSMRTLAEAMRPKVTAQAISKYEAGKVLPSSAVLVGLGKALDVSLDSLMSAEVEALDAVEFRKHSGASARDRARAEAVVMDSLERCPAIEHILDIEAGVDWVVPRDFLARERSNDSPASHDPLSMRDTSGIAPAATAVPPARACRTSATASTRITRSSELKSSSAPRPDRDGRTGPRRRARRHPDLSIPSRRDGCREAPVAAKRGRAGGPSGVGGGGLAGAAGDCGGAGQAGTSEARRQWRCAATDGEVVAVSGLHPRIARRHWVGVRLAHTVRRRATSTPWSKPPPSPPLPPPSACSPTAVRATLASRQRGSAFASWPSSWRAGSIPIWPTTGCRGGGSGRSSPSSGALHPRWTCS